MTNIEMEEKLSEQGFSAREIALLKHRVEQDTTTYQALLIDLRKRFIGCVIFLLVVLFYFGGAYFIRGQSDFLSTILTLIFTLIVFWFLAPLKLGAKAYLFIRNNSYL